MPRNKVLRLMAIGLLTVVGAVTVVHAALDTMYRPFRIKEGVRAARAYGAQGAQDFFTSVFVWNSSGKVVAGIFPDDFEDGLLGIANRNEEDRVIVDVSGQDAGRVYVLNNSSQPTFIMDGIQGIGSVAGDVAEMFPASEAIEAGSVVVIDAQNRGAMRRAAMPYDRRVAGVVAGANDYRAAITLRALGDPAGKIPVTLTGTAYCLATNTNGPIRAGDLLTTSAVPGHAMKVTDHAAARGAILGKALENLESDKGHILVLASLQ